MCACVCVMCGNTLPGSGSGYAVPPHLEPRPVPGAETDLVDTGPGLAAARLALPRGPCRGRAGRRHPLPRPMTRARAAFSGGHRSRPGSGPIVPDRPGLGREPEES